MAKLPNKPDLEQLSKDELIKEVLRMHRRCDKLSNKVKSFRSREAEFYDRYISLRNQGIELAKAYDYNIYLISVLELHNKLHKMGRSICAAVHPWKLLTDVEQLSLMHRSEN